MFEKNPAVLIDEIEAMRAGIDYRMSIKVRSLERKLRPLTINETLEVGSLVRARWKQLDDDQKSPLMESVLLAQETLMKASTSDEGKTDMTITSLMMGKMTPDELQSIHKQYVQAVERVNPQLDLMEREEIDKLASALKKKSKDEVVLALTTCSFRELLSLTHSLLTTDALPTDK